jgi:peptide/nickel transport system permease protein
MMGTGLIFAFIGGILLGVLSSKKPYSKTDNLTTITSLIGYSLPVFWSAQLLLLAFAIYLGWFPVGGMRDLVHEYTGIYAILDLLKHLTLPALVIGVYQLAIYTRLTRSSMLDVLHEDYIMTARSKGLPERTVLFKHALRNALLPVVTVMSMNLGIMFAGAVLTETVFAWPGVGRLTYDAIFARDYPVIMGTFVVVSIMVIIVNLITDIVYSVLDPRVRG